MTREEALAVVEREGLRRAVWDRRPGNSVDSVAIFEDDDAWWVVATDERAVEMGLKRFERESEALEHFVKRLRALNRLLASKTIG